MLTILAMTLGIAALLTIIGLSVAKFFVIGFEFWPPPTVKSWQHQSFRWLFRVFFVSLIALSVLDFRSDNFWQHLVGAALMLGGFGLALRWTSVLGWKDAFGDPNSLKIRGPYARSRNPIYVVSIAGMVGWGLAIGSDKLAILLGLWALVYAAAPFLEEPWLERHFGSEYRNYMQKVPRYFRLRG